MFEQDPEKEIPFYQIPSILNRQSQLKNLYQKHCQKPTIKYIFAQYFRFFKKFKYKMKIYSLGDQIHIWDISECMPYVGSILKIIQVPEEVIPFLQVNWYMKKADLPQKDSLIKNNLSAFSEAEVFPSSINFFLPITAIKQKCDILSINEYEQLSLTPPCTYFTRAQYKQGEFHPAIETWPSSCFCGMPDNPDLEYVQCQNCQKWLHMECMKISDVPSKVVCPDCQRNIKNTRRYL